MLLIGTVFYLLSGLLLLKTAAEINHRLNERISRTLSAALEADRQRLVLAVRDFARMEDAPTRLKEAFGGTASGESLAASISRDLGIDPVLVISPQAIELHSAQETTILPQSGMEAGVSRLVLRAKSATAPSAAPPVSAHLMFRGQPVIAVADLVPRTTDGADPVVLVFMMRLTPELLGPLARRLALERLSVALRDEAGGDEGTHLHFLTEDGQALTLQWVAPDMGGTVVTSAAPWFAAGGLGLAGLAWMAVAAPFRRGRRSHAPPEALAPADGSDAAPPVAGIADLAIDWTWEADRNLRLTHLSDGFAAFTGRAPAQFIGSALSEVLHPSDTALETWIEETTASGLLPPLRCRYITQAGEVRICRTAARVVRDAEGRCTGYVGTATDITNQVEAHWRVEHLALHDPLTNLPNRILLMEFLAGALGAAQAGDRSVAVICVDIGHFKKINEGFGLAVGDQVLVEAAQRLRQCVRDNDLVARVGADEFVVVASGPGSVTMVEALCQRLRAALNRPIAVEAGDIHPVAALGIAMAPSDADDPEGLVRCAELALQAAKQTGNGTYRFFSADMNEQVVAKRALENDLRRSIGSNEFKLVFQPRFESATLKPVGVEALVRWDHPRLGRLTPDRFISLAETTGLIIPLGEWVVREACAVIARYPGLNVSVNVSPVQFRQGELIATVESALAESALPPHRLELEVTENVLMENIEKALGILVGLKGLGVRLAMDDFGTGYSSLGYLRTFPFDAIKIDRRFVGDLEESEGAIAIVHAIIGLGHALGMHVIAEGVETEAQREHLRLDQCDEMQGYHFARPLSETDLAAFLAAYEAEPPGVPAG